MDTLYLPFYFHKVFKSKGIQNSRSVPRIRQIARKRDYSRIKVPFERSIRRSSRDKRKDSHLDKVKFKPTIKPSSDVLRAEFRKKCRVYENLKEMPLRSLRVWMVKRFESCARRLKSQATRSSVLRRKLCAERKHSQKFKMRVYRRDALSLQTDVLSNSMENNGGQRECKLQFAVAWPIRENFLFFLSPRTEKPRYAYIQEFGHEGDNGTWEITTIVRAQ